MNISEANAWYAFLRSLETSATDEQRAAGADAASKLTERAYNALNAGPRPIEVERLVAELHAAVELAEHDDLTIELGPRPVETAQPAGGVL